MAVAGAPRLVILRALGLGDLLTAVPALRGLARAFPGHVRMLLAPAPLRGLVGLVDADGSPAVDAVVPLHGLDAPVPARAHAPDVAVNLHGRGPQSHRLLRALAPRRLLAFSDPDRAQDDAPAWRPEEHEVRRWTRLLEACGVRCDPGELDLAPPPGPPRFRGATILHPGAASAARRWPVDRWAAIARRERAAGRRVLITGSRAERPLAAAVAVRAGLGADAVAADGSGLVALASRIAGAGRVVCGDTGVAHLATAVGTPSVVLFGPVPPAEWGPPPNRPRHLTLWAGRRGDPHADRPDPGLLELSVDDVAGALDQLRARSTSRS